MRNTMSIRLFTSFVFLSFIVANTAQAYVKHALIVNMSDHETKNGKVYVARTDYDGTLKPAEVLLSDATVFIVAERGGHFVYRNPQGEWLRGNLIAPDEELEPISHILPGFGKPDFQFQSRFYLSNTGKEIAYASNNLICIGCETSPISSRNIAP